MAGHVRKLENGRWIARFPVGGRGRFRSRTFDRKRDAQSWLTTQTSRRDRGEWIDPTLAGESFRSVAEAWERSRRNVAPSTAARDGSYLKTLILPALGDYELRHITVDVLNDWVGDLDQEKAPATVRKAFQLAAAILDSAVAAGKVATNPARIRKAIELPPLPHEEMRFLSADEVYRLADRIEPRYRALVLTAAFTGLRWGELVGLKAKHLNLETGRLSVVETLSEVGGYTSFKAPKTAASKRTVTLPAGLVDVLRQHLSDWPAVGNGLVFTWQSGTPILRSNFRQRMWEPALEAAGLAPLRFHDLRHSHAALLIGQGEHVKVIQSRLGHSSISVTMDTYGHLLEGLDSGTATRLDAAMKHYGSTDPKRTPASVGAGSGKKA
ncbi:MAG TPA: tyrosine-type recombinase/integrase [Acidimicrobiia bacterium]|nr:tyrosine-type recombinase/integrase [Acidimicrobiia bacterium]